MPLSNRHGAVGLAGQGPGGVAVAVRVGVGEAVVPKVFDGYLGGDFGGATKVVDVQVGDYEVVKMLEARGLGEDFEDAGRVAAARVARVDENALAGGRDDEGGTTAVRVAPPDVQPPVGLSGYEGQGEGRDKG